MYFRFVKRIILLILLIGVSALSGFSQVGGRHIYDFLNLIPSARIAALGGVNVSTIDNDVHFGSQNPALVTPEMHGRASLSYSPYLAGIHYGYSGYSHSFDGIGSFHTAIQYMNTGSMQGADEFGNFTQTFSAQELVWMIGGSRAWRGFRYGTNLKVISSSLAPGYGSWGMAMDLGGTFRSKDSLFSAGLVLRNMGVQLSTYTGTGSREPLPFEVVAGISNKLRYMPMRFSLTFIQLEHPDLIIDDPDAEVEVDLNGNPILPGPRIADHIFRHFVFGTEFYLGSFMRLRAGYNHLRRQELRGTSRGGFTGFSLGVGINTQRFAFDYGFRSYGIGSVFGVHQFSLTVQLAQKYQSGQQ